MKTGWKIFLIILGVFVLILILAAVYLYYFGVFYIARICVSNNSTETYSSCSSKQECLNLLLSNINNSDLGRSFNEMPESLKQKAMDMISSAVYCDRTCKFNEISYRGGLSWEDKGCKPGEQELTYKIIGKEALQLLKFLKDKKDTVKL